MRQPLGKRSTNVQLDFIIVESYTFTIEAWLLTKVLYFSITQKALRYIQFLELIFKSFHGPDLRSISLYC